MISRRQKILDVLGLLAGAAVAACLTFPLWVDYVEDPPWVVVRIPERMKRLQPGMSRRQVRQQLGLTGSRPYGEGSGPTSDYREGSNLWPGCGLLLVFDRTGKPERLKRAELVGEGWKQWPFNLKK
ncbi:MAG TPA: hypothetical protein VK689_01410 [Armatimonadota bacterium]|nr:hypothetical protein [Armatimonadota bacterium]